MPLDRDENVIPCSYRTVDAWLCYVVVRKGRRCYAAVEAVNLGYGGISDISRLSGCDYRAIKSGACELADESALHQPRIRRRDGDEKYRRYQCDLFASDCGSCRRVSHG